MREREDEDGGSWCTTTQLSGDPHDCRYRNERALMMTDAKVMCTGKNHGTVRFFLSLPPHLASTDDKSKPTTSTSHSNCKLPQ